MDNQNSLFIYAYNFFYENDGESLYLACLDAPN